MLLLKSITKNIWKKDKMSLVKTTWLDRNINDVKIIDSSWHMPQVERDGFEEYKKHHIPNAIFLIWMIIQKRILAFLI